MNESTRPRHRHRRWKRPERMRSTERVSLVVAGVYFTLLAMFGGGMVNWTSAYMLLIAATIGAAGFAAWRDGFAALGRIPLSGRIAVTGIAILPLLQLVPLPPALWHILPGQSLRIATLGLIGAADTWQPLTLDPIGTGLSAILGISFVTLLTLLMRLDDPGFDRMIDLMLGIILFGIMIGILQVVSDGRFPNPHEVDTGPLMLGTYANKNHMGLAIACGMMAFGLLLAPRFDPRMRQWIVMAGSIFALVCIVTTNSRAGLLLGILGAIILFAGSLRRLSWKYWLAAAVVLGALAMFVMSSAAYDLVAARFGDVDDDLRWNITNWSLPLAARYWLNGSGAGSYVAVFNPAEQLAWVKATYVNAAHNDYLQTVIELGVAGIVLVALLAISVVQCFPALRGGAKEQLSRQAMFGTVVIVMFALHSVVDYPLRRPAAWIFFALALAALYRARSATRKAP